MMEIINQKHLQICVSYKNLFIIEMKRVFRIRNQRKMIAEKIVIIHINCSKKINSSIIGELLPSNPNIPRFIIIIYQ